jgi:ABC-2 type transport system ATP-binding protein
MIRLSSVTKQFGDRRAVDDVSLEVSVGDVVGFLGVNGAGKTTTMRMITGILAPTKGRVTVDGHDPIEDHVVVSRKIGYLPENNPLYPDMKVREYLAFIRHAKGSGDVTAIVDAVNLSEVLHKKIEELSRGYRQRVGLAAALLGDPRILILDEPTSGLDPIEQDKIRALVKTIAKDKVVIFSTHILSEVEDIATRLIIINRGKSIYDGEKPPGKGAVEKMFKELVSLQETKV